MITKLFSVYDAKAEIYHRPMHFLTTGEALRTFIDEASKEGSMIASHPEDFYLFEVGSYDDTTGQTKTLDPGSCLGRAIDLVRQTPAGQA